MCRDSADLGKTTCRFFHHILSFSANRCTTTSCNKDTYTTIANRPWEQLECFSQDETTNANIQHTGYQSQDRHNNLGRRHLSSKRLTARHKVLLYRTSLAKRMSNHSLQQFSPLGVSRSWRNVKTLIIGH